LHSGAERWAPESALCARVLGGFWAVPVDTLLAALYSQDSQTLLMRLTKIQVGQLWKKDASGDIYLV